VEIDVLGMATNHSKRVAYLSLKLSQELGMCFEELHDIVSRAILHDNGVSEKSLHDELIN
jgi:HD-GYP domain-containing protein (c-di-GMP phosphodiesterase class II)